MHIDDLLDGEPSLRSGEFGLWLKVFSLSFLELQKGRFTGSAAKEFLFDPENPFFDYIAGELGYEAADFREKILKILERSKGERQETWQDRIRAKYDHGAARG